ncbi:hypothetical protein A6A06_21835 [Streptomyces sp. CB02923]|uniref:hypothetical protein n=1 Tax=Streptomyces sp. CB02923 TaxID=1718985 RepID=UPI00093BC365|nr:hypothetical protein [Streptomyces sp. CB02923]OKH99726.1 hypothetical protein A6A06_21835 [Streptomyces sp. CB02923]
MNGPQTDGGGAAGRALRASGLPALWAARYPALAGPKAQARAAAHVCGSLEALPGPYRLGAIAVLRTAGLALRITAARRSRPAAGCDRLLRVPGFSRILTITDSLALYGGLDGERNT